MEILLPAIKLMTYIGIGSVAVGVLAIRGIFRGSRSKFNYAVGAVICFALGIYFLNMKSSGSIKITEDSLTLKAILSKTQVIEIDEIQRAWVENLEDTECPSTQHLSRPCHDHRMPRMSGNIRSRHAVHRARWHRD